jgi:hypothetical protein
MTQDVALPLASGAVAPRTEAPVWRTLRIGFGALWLLDGLLQAQPRMFTMDMISTVMQPSATGEPGWLTALINTSIRVVGPHIALFNAFFVLLQLGIGALLLCGGRPRLVRTGATLSLAWALVVWLFGEGLGQLLTGSATALSGAPGSVLLYAVVAVLLLARPAVREAAPLGRPLVAWLTAALFALGALLELNPLFFTPLGLASVFGQGAAMSQPHLFGAPIAWATDLADARPLLVNGLVIALFALSALAVLLPATRGRGRALNTLAWALPLAFLFVVWWLGQDFGMPFGGMATDPNTAVPLGLLVVAARQAMIPLSARNGAQATNDDGGAATVGLAGAGLR